MKKLITLITLLISCSCAHTLSNATRVKQSQSVVMVMVHTTVTDPLTLAQQPAAWSGTGFSVKADVDGSDIVTNQHVCVAKGNADYELTDYAGKKHVAKWQRNDEAADLCLLHTKDIIAPVKLAQADARKGDHISAIGAPHGQFPWFADGIATGKMWCAMADEEFGLAFSVHFWAQGTSIPIYPGNSGSPVWNDAGEVVGIVFAARRDSDHISYIVPVSEIKRFLDTSENIYER